MAARSNSSLYFSCYFGGGDRKPARARRPEKLSPHTSGPKWRSVFRGWRLAGKGCETSLFRVSLARRGDWTCGRLAPNSASRVEGGSLPESDWYRGLRISNLAHQGHAIGEHLHSFERLFHALPIEVVDLRKLTGCYIARNVRYQNTLRISVSDARSSSVISGLPLNFLFSNWRACESIRR